jgi:integrase
MMKLSEGSKPRSKAVAVPLPDWVYTVTARGKVYYYFQRRRGKPDAGPRIRLPEINTPEWFAALAAATESRPVAPAGSLETVWEAYRASPRGPRTKGTATTYMSAWRIIQPIWGDLPPSRITPEAVAKIHDKLADRPVMANLVLTVLRMVMAEAVRRGMIERNPTADLRPHEITNVDGAKPLTSEAWAVLMAPACPRAVYRLAILGRATGQRISDLVTMCPAMRKGDGIEHGIQKKARRMKAPHWDACSKDYLAIIDSWGGFPNAPWVNVDGRVTKQSVRNQWNAYIRTHSGAALDGFTPHDLRATNFCDHILAGDTPADIARIRNVGVDKVYSYTQHLTAQEFAQKRSGQNKAGTGT